MDNRFYIYSHVRKTDGKCFYIGKGTGERYKKSQGRNKWWKNIVEKHGFEPIILINNISEKKAFELESIMCEQIGYENLCNIRKEIGNGGWTVSDETKNIISEKNKKPKPLGFGEKISKINRGRKWTEEQKQNRKGKGKSKRPEGTGKKISEANTGMKRSEETKFKQRKPKSNIHRENISKSLKNIKRSQETKNKISAAKKGKPKPFNFIKNLTENNKKYILQYDLEGNFIKEWLGLNEISINLNINPRAISNCCLGISKKSGGFIWKYKM